MRSSWCRRARVGELPGVERQMRVLTPVSREESDREGRPIDEEDQQAWFRSMWEGKEDEPAQPAEPDTEPAAPEGDAPQDDDDFGDDFDDFAEGQEADDDFGDFDEADETPMAPESQPPVQTQQPDILAGLVSSVQSIVCSQDSRSFVPANTCISAAFEPFHTYRHRHFYSALPRRNIPRFGHSTRPKHTIRYARFCIPL